METIKTWKANKLGSSSNPPIFGCSSWLWLRSGRLLSFASHFSLSWTFFFVSGTTIIITNKHKIKHKPEDHYLSENNRNIHTFTRAFLLYNFFFIFSLLHVLDSFEILIILPSSNKQKKITHKVPPIFMNHVVISHSLFIYDKNHLHQQPLFICSHILGSLVSKLYYD